MTVRQKLLKLREYVLKRLPETLVSAALLGVLLTFFVTAMSKKSGLAFYETAVALASLILFFLCACACVFSIGKEIRESVAKRNPEALRECEGVLPEGPISQKPPRKRIAGDILIIGVSCLVFTVMTIVLTALIIWASGRSGSFSDVIRFRFGTLDSQHYLYIAEHGYTPSTSEDYGRVVEIVFLPGYPLLVKLFSFVIRDFFAAGMVVSFLSFTASAILLYLLVTEESSREDALYSVIILFMLPGAFFFISPMTESLFLALTLATVLMIRKKKWLLAGLFGMYCAFTRSIGVIVAVIYVFELAKDFLSAISNRNPEDSKAKTVGRYILKLLPVLLIVSGILVFMVYNKILDGSFTAFLDYEKKQWSQSAGWFFDTARYSSSNIVKYLSGRIGKSRYVGLSVFAMDLVAIFGILGVLFAKRKKIRASFLTYALIYFAISFGVTWLLSGIRYMDGLFVLPLALSAGSGRYICGSVKATDDADDRKLARGRARSVILICMMSVLSGIYLVMFCLNWQIW